MFLIPKRVSNECVIYFVKGVYEYFDKGVYVCMQCTYFWFAILPATFYFLDGDVTREDVKSE